MTFQCANQLEFQCRASSHEERESFIGELKSRPNLFEVEEERSDRLLELVVYNKVVENYSS